MFIEGFGRQLGGKRALGRPRRRWEDNIKMELGYLKTVSS